MAYLASQFTDSLAYIYDNDNNFIAKTTVTGHDRDEMYIEITDGLKKIKPKTRLNLLIIHPKGVSELYGTLKSVRQGVYEIAVYGERQRDVRAASRHKLNVPAVISDMVTEIAIETLPVPQHVIVENMSKTGILVKTSFKRFDIGSLLQIELEVNGKSLIIYGEVVREEIYEDQTFGYGCQLVFLE